MAKGIFFLVILLALMGFRTPFIALILLVILLGLLVKGLTAGLPPWNPR